MNYADLIKQLRTKLILTQSELAELLGSSYISVCRWEKGVFEPTIKMKRKIVELCRKNNIELEIDRE